VAEAEGARLRLGAASGGAEPKKELVDQAFDPGNVTATRLESGRVDVYLPIRLGVHRIGALAVLGMRVSERMAAGCTALLGLALEREKFLRLARAAEEIRIREEMKSTLLATLAHDLKTPVTAARAAVENMEAERGASERTRLAKESMQKLTRLIDDLLNVVKLEAGAAHPERERVWCGAILDAAVERFGDALGAHTLHVEAPPPEWAVNVDPAQVAEALGLGLENAARYSPSGGPVDVSVVRKGGTLALRVDDAGAGIPMGERKRVLDKFVRLPGNDGIPGSGLGLYLARTLVEMNGGRVEIGESERHGTRFEILLPEASS
ncbi:MAG TPA: ATP-binding protein, partial [Thermoanaerobaculia bacterium]|nr:ATP-binding protein [Thermoanaerobaculia bacterium]